MLSNSGRNYNDIQTVSFPRSGHHLLERLSGKYFQEPIYCDYYGCCRSIPCAKGFPLRKNHDMEGNLPNEAGSMYIVQLRRSGQAQFNAYFRFFRDLYSRGPREFEVDKHFNYFTGYYDKYFRVFLDCPDDLDAHEDSYHRFITDHLDSYRKFIDKWVISNANPNCYLLFYEDLVNDTSVHLSNVIRMLSGEYQIDEDRLSRIISEESVEMKHDLTASPFYNPAFNQQYSLPELSCFSSGPAHPGRVRGNLVSSQVQKIVRLGVSPAAASRAFKTAVFILNHNLPKETDVLYSALEPFQGRDYDLFVLDNGSAEKGMAKNTTHRLKENLFWGGALNWAFRFIIENRKYDSLLFLNNDLSLNGADFVRRLRDELLSGPYRLVSPCLAGPAQPWPQMQCWDSGAMRPVKWIDMPAPLFHRKLVERIGQFDDSLQYGWGQELVCAHICEMNSWSIGVADHISVEHLGSATLKNHLARETFNGLPQPLSREEFEKRARAAYESLIQSRPGYFGPMVQWGKEYDSETAGFSKINAGAIRAITDIINRLIRHFDYRRYLEIGVGDGRNFNRVVVQHRDGVDPEASIKVKYPVASDHFFAVLPDDTEYDIIFVDGLNEEKQVLRDIHNSLRHLARDGSILVHACNPDAGAHHLSKSSMREQFGTTWKAWARLRCCRGDLQMSVLEAGRGVGIIRRGSQKTFPEKINTLDLDYLAAHQSQLLNLVPVEQYFDSLSDTALKMPRLVINPDKG